MYSWPVSGLAPGEDDIDLGNRLFTPYTIITTLLSRSLDSRRLDFSSATYRRHISFLKMHAVYLIVICLVQLSSTFAPPTLRILIVRGANTCCRDQKWPVPSERSMCRLWSPKTFPSFIDFMSKVIADTLKIYRSIPFCDIYPEFLFRCRCARRNSIISMLATI
jgi:hypothetical protein